MTLSDALSSVDAGLDAALARLGAWVAIPSVSADPAHASDCRAGANWLATDLKSIGFEVEVVETRGHPIVVARRARADAPRALFYGHYDVQPADQPQAWRTPPFEMTVVQDPVHGQILVGRGTSDDKGQVMTFVEACRALVETDGVIPLDITMVIEGEEETGSPNLSTFLENRRDALQVDMVLACDTDMAAIDVPGITVSMRGVIHDEFVLNCARHDLHSGVYGGAARNPLHVVATVIAALHQESGHIAIPGFYDGAEAFALSDVDDDDGSFLRDIGLTTSVGEPGVSPRQQTLFRPSVDINGIWGGYSGVGSKTVIPSQAGAKVSFRLIPGQDPSTVRDRFRAFVRSLLPPDCTVTFHGTGAGSVAMRIESDFAIVERTSVALEAEWGHKTEMIATGGTIPAVSEIKRLFGLQTLMVGFSHEDDRQHGTNEKFDLRSFHKGIRSWLRILHALA